MRDLKFATFSLLLAFCIPSYSQTPSLGANPSQLYEKGMNSLVGVGVSRNDLNAVDYIRRSAELGYLPAQVVLGTFYDTGGRVSQNSTEAAQWYKKAALQDDRLADWLLGRLYYTGNGVPRDLNTAEQWLQKAADQGDPFGQYLLGLTRLERQDYAKATQWFRKAAMQGLPQAQQQLGELLQQGKGAAVDKFEAFVWLEISFEAGNLLVTSELQALEADLGTNRTEEAKSKTRELRQSVTRSIVAHGCTGWPGEFNPVPTPPPADLQRFCR